MVSGRAILWTAAALMGIVVTAVLAWSGSQLAGQHIGLSSEPLSVATGLAPSRLEDIDRPAVSRRRPANVKAGATGPPSARARSTAQPSVAPAVPRPAGVRPSGAVPPAATPTAPTVTPSAATNSQDQHRGGGSGGRSEDGGGGSAASGGSGGGSGGGQRDD
jgi:uncharacterized membrane protein YgcG